MLNFADQLSQLAQGMKSEEPDYHAIHTFLGPSLEPRSGGFPVPTWNGPDQAGGGGQAFDLATNSAGSGQIVDGAVTVGKIATGAVDITKFASGIIPPRIVTELPTLPDANYPPTSLVVLDDSDDPNNGKMFRNVADVWTAAVALVDISGLIVGTLPDLPNAAYPDGAPVVLTTDGKVYRVHGGAWVKTTDGADIIAGSIIAAAIAAATITGDKIAATTIAAANIVANTITAGQIAAGAIGADQIAAGAVTTNKLSLKDDFGETILDASGFGETWDDFIASGIRNNMFVKAIPGALAVGTSRDDPAGRYSHLPNWTVWRSTGSGTASVVANPAWPGGHYVACGFSNVGSSTTNNVALTTDPFPVMPGLGLGPLLVRAFEVGAGDVAIDVHLLFYAADETFISSVDLAAEIKGVGSYPMAQLDEVDTGLVAVPVNARSARLEINTWEETTHSVTNSAHIGGSILAVHPGVMALATLTATDLRATDSFQAPFAILGPITVTTGDTFPTSDLSIGDICFRTDLGEWCYYDGAQWLTTALHYISISDGNIQVINDGSTASPINGNCATMSALPASGVVAVQVGVTMSCSTANSGNYVAATEYNHAPTQMNSVECYGAPTAGYYTHSQGSVPVGGDRQIRYQVGVGAGTITYYIHVVGYWGHVIRT